MEAATTPAFPGMQAPPPAPPADGEPTKFKCPDCEREFDTKQGLGRHRTTTHGAPGTRKKTGKRAAKDAVQRKRLVRNPADSEAWSIAIAGLENAVEQTRLANAETVARLAEARYAQALYDAGRIDESAAILDRI